MFMLILVRSMVYKLILLLGSQFDNANKWILATDLGNIAKQWNSSVDLTVSIQVREAAKKVIFLVVRPL